MCPPLRRAVCTRRDRATRHRRCSPRDRCRGPGAVRVRTFAALTFTRWDRRTVDRDRRLALSPSEHRGPSRTWGADVSVARIAVVAGDGIGTEVTAQARRVIEAVLPDVEFDEYDLGARFYNRTHEVL